MTGLTTPREIKSDLILLDWVLPGLLGWKLYRQWPTVRDKAPVILLIGKDDVSDRVAGLDAGANNYVLKAFSVRKLLTKVRAHLRGAQEPSPDLLIFEYLSLNR